MQYHSQAVDHKKRCDETAFHNMCNATHFLLVTGKDVMRLSFTNCAMNVTHSLLVIGNNVISLPFTKCAVSLTSCWSKEKM